MKCPCCKYQETEDAFNKVEVVEHVDLETRSGWAGRAGPEYNLNVDCIYLNICPKCGVAFKEV